MSLGIKDRLKHYSTGRIIRDSPHYCRLGHHSIAFVRTTEDNVLYDSANRKQKISHVQH
jgi:hypothetical protein